MYFTVPHIITPPLNLPCGAETWLGETHSLGPGSSHEELTCTTLHGLLRRKVSVRERKEGGVSLNGEEYTPTNPSCQHLVQKDPTTPPISGKTVGFSPQHLRSNILRGPCNGVGPLSNFKPLGAAKVGEEDVASFREHAILRLQVPTDKDIRRH